MTRRPTGFTAVRTLVASSAVAGTLLLVAPTNAQPADPAAAPAAPADPAAGDPPPPAAAAAPDAAPLAVPPDAADGELKDDPLAAALRPAPGGLTPERAAARAAETSPLVAATRAELAAAAAKVDRAFVAYFPILQTSFTYARMSEVQNSFDTGISIPGVDMSGFAFPVILNSFSWATSLTVPFSDYLFRLTQAYAAASQSEQAKRLEARAEELKAQADAKVHYLTWVRAKGTRVVSKMAVEATTALVEDARITLEAGLLSRADLLGLESQLAGAENAALATQTLEQVAAEQLRTTIRAKPGQRLTVGIDLLGPPPEVNRRPLGELQRTALRQRLELQAVQATKRSLQEARSLSRAGLFPRLDGFANLLVANPNQRVFPQEEKWDATWELGLRASWTLNETFSTLAADDELSAQIRVLDHQLQALKDGIKLGVAASYYNAMRARSSIAAAERAEEAASEALRVRRDRFRAGKATSTDIVEAETQLTRARLQRVDANVSLRVALAQLQYALGLGAPRAAAAGRGGQ